MRSCSWLFLLCNFFLQVSTEALKSKQHLRQYLQDNFLTAVTHYSQYIHSTRNILWYECTISGSSIRCAYIAMTSNMTNPPPFTNLYSSLPSAWALTIWLSQTIQRPRHPIWNICQPTNTNNVWEHSFQPNLKELSWVFIYKIKAFYLDSGHSSLQKAP